MGTGRRAAGAPDGPALDGGEQHERREGVHRALRGAAAAYRLEGRKIQTGKANENGDVEQSHHRLKRAVEQTLLLRGSRDFASVADYQEFLRRLLAQLNAGRRERLAVEMQYLRALPERRLESVKHEKVKVDSGSIIYVDRNAYSVNSRLIGERVEARLKVETVEVSMPAAR